MERKENLKKLDVFYKYIRDIGTLEQELLKGKIIISAKEEWEKRTKALKILYANYSKIRLSSLSIKNRIELQNGTLFSDEMVIENRTKFLELLLSCINGAEKKYQNYINEENLPFIMMQIRIICYYQYLTSSISELEYYAKTNRQDFETKVEKLVGKQRNIYNHYQWANFLIFGKLCGKINEQMEFAANFNQSITNERELLLNDKMPINSVKDWNLFKKTAIASQECYSHIHKTLSIQMDNEGITSYNRENEEYLQIVVKCIKKLEEKYQGHIIEQDLPIIMVYIKTICMYNQILFEMEEMIKTTKKNPFDQTFIIKDEIDGKGYNIRVDLVKEFQRLVIQRSELFEKYKAADAFVFGNVEEESLQK